MWISIAKNLNFTPWCSLIWRLGGATFSIDLTLPAHYNPGVDSASNRNVYQEFSSGVEGGLTAICEPIA
jgi:hypothetical protein